MTCVLGHSFILIKRTSLNTCLLKSMMPIPQHAFLYFQIFTCSRYKNLFKFINTPPSLKIYYLCRSFSLCFYQNDRLFSGTMDVHESENVCTIAPAVANKKEYETIHQICYCVRSECHSLPPGFIPDCFC